MDLTLFVVFLIITLVIIFLSFYAPEHSELGLVGFLFLFLLSLVILGGDIQYKIGTNETLTYGCICCEEYEYYDYNRSEFITVFGAHECENSTLNITPVVTGITKVDQYATFTAGGTVSHVVGYYLAVASLVGFIGVILGLKAQFKQRREEDE